jgi:CHASE3 domain sensor protein
MKRTATRVLVVAGLVGAALLVANAALMLRNAQQVHEDTRLVAHTQRVISQLEGILSMVMYAESGQRGYLITGDAKFLEPYKRTVAGIRERVADSKQLTADNPRQQDNFRALEIGINARLASLDEGIALRDRHAFDAARNYMLEGGGIREMDRVRAQVAKMMDEERALRDGRAKQADRSYRIAILTAFASALFGIAVLAAFLLFLRRYLANRERAEAEEFEQRERMRTTLASIGDAVISTDRDARVTYLNPVAEALTGWKSDEARG